MQKRAFAGVGVIACAVFLMSRTQTGAQEGSGSSRASPPRATRPMTPDEFYAAFWKHIARQDSPYTKWGSPKGKEGLREGQSPHGDLVKTFANKAATDSPDALPYGAIIVAENYAKDKTTLKDITVMYRVKGADPKHNDWYWLKYLPNGTIARTPEKEGKKPIAGKVAACAECHSKAGGSDYVFANDPRDDADKK